MAWKDDSSLVNLAALLKKQPAGMSCSDATELWPEILPPFAGNDPAEPTPRLTRERTMLFRTFAGIVGGSTYGELLNQSSVKFFLNKLLRFARYNAFCRANPKSTARSCCFPVFAGGFQGVGTGLPWNQTFKS
jgi:hypothetical protein